LLYTTSLAPRIMQRCLRAHVRADNFQQKNIRSDFIFSIPENKRNSIIWDFSCFQYVIENAYCSGVESSSAATLSCFITYKILRDFYASEYRWTASTVDELLSYSPTAKPFQTRFLPRDVHVTYRPMHSAAYDMVSVNQKSVFCRNEWVDRVDFRHN